MITSIIKQPVRNRRRVTVGRTSRLGWSTCRSINNNDKIEIALYEFLQSAQLSSGNSKTYTHDASPGWS